MKPVTLRGNLPNILIVDDTEENLIYLEAVIGKINLNIIRAQSGAEALEKSKGTDLMLAILDVSMPEMTGYELAVKLNEARPGKNVPVIFLTARHYNSDDLLEGYNSGAVDYIFKPVSHYILQSKINIFLDLYNQKQMIVRNLKTLKQSADELTRVNKAIVKSEKKFRSYIDNAPDGIFVMDGTGKFSEVNKAMCRITGYSMQELLQMTFSDIHPDASLQESMDQIGKVVLAGTSKSDLLFRSKDGSEMWWAFEAIRLSKTKYLGFVKDITLRKRAEEELKSSLEQLHFLHQYIEKVREDERVSLSRDLHDELGQALTAIKIDLGIIRQNCNEDKMTQKINNVLSLVGETIKTVQRLTSELRPQIIEDLGLEAAIEWYTNDFANRNRMEFSLHIDSKVLIPPGASLTLFRIMQESLTNIARHSQADRVEIGLNQDSEYIYFRISDNGIGITENDISSKKSFGLMSMKERAAALGARLDIGKNKGQGTLIKLIMPINL